jgi:YgiT-type zinc finger domain-containing protein
MPKERARDLSTAIAPCPECQTGVFYLQHITYFTWLNEELVTVPNFPAWVCDMCGRREYDMRAVKWLNALLHPEAGRNSPRRRGQVPGAEASLGADQPQLQ